METNFVIYMLKWHIFELVGTIVISLRIKNCAYFVMLVALFCL